MADDVRDSILKTIAQAGYVAQRDPHESSNTRRQKWDAMTDAEKAPHLADALDTMRRQAVREIVFEIIENPGKHFNHKDAPYLEDGQESWVDRIMAVVEWEPGSDE